MKTTFILFLFFVSAIGLKSQAPDLKFEILDSKNGLSNSNIWAIQKDYKGFLWIGTEDGLNLYDGYSFKVFRTNLKDTNSISCNAIHCFYADKLVLWTGAREGLNQYDWQTGKFQRFFPELTVDEATGKTSKVNNHAKVWRNSINVIVKDARNRLLVGTDLGFLEFDCQKKYFKSIRNENTNFQLDSIPVNCAATSPNNVWIGSNTEGLFKLDMKTNQLSQFFKSFSIISILYENDSSIWLGTYNGAIHFNSLTGNYKIFGKTNDANSIVGNQIDVIIKGNNELIWFGTTTGLSLFDPKKEVFYNYLPVSGEEKSLSSQSIKAMYKDDAGIIWLGTRLGGINIYDTKSTKFEHFKHKLNNNNTLSNNVISKIEEDENRNIWIATDGGGLNKFDRRTNKFTVYQSKAGNTNSLTTNKVLALYADKKGGLWIGMWEGGLDYLDIEKQQFTHFKNSLNGKVYKDYRESSNIYNNWVFYILGDREGDLWLALWGGGLNRYDTKRKLFTKYPVKDREKFSEMESHVGVVLLEDKWGDIWYGTQQTGLYRYNKQRDEMTRFVNEAGNPNSISDNNIYSLREDSQKRIWIGTDGGGLNLYNRKANNFTSFRISDGLPSDVITGILEDNRGRLWLSTGNGISCATFTENKGVLSGSFKNYTVEDGLQGMQFVRWASLKSATGELYFGGLNGFNIINPEKIIDNNYLPPVVFTDFQVHYKSVVPSTENAPLTKHIAEAQELVLQYFQDVITFEFSALNFTHPEKNQYAFYMKGFDAEWHYVGNQRKATYTNLNAGEYTFYVKGSNNDGVWNEKPISVKVIVFPPWWKTWWFRTLLILITLGSISSFFGFRIRKIRKQKERLEVLVNKRTAQLQATNEKLREKQNEIIQQNEEIHQQAEELAAQRDDLSEKNQQITFQHDQIKSSIRYAQTIQQAILPSEKQLQAKFDCFILYQPKDVVSGDFYWFTELDKSADNVSDTILAVVDCTGHGVPGAFMSMIGSSLLNKIVNEQKITDPEKILNKLNYEIEKSLRQDVTDNSDGMDIVLCRITETENKHFKIIFAGARSPLFYYQSATKTVGTIKGSHKFIGGKYAVHQVQNFTNTELQLEKNDVLYLASDGFVDQNNIERKRFGTTQFVENLKLCAQLPINEQKTILLNSLSKWQNSATQRDDITIIGIKF